jgi:hypothetical protein
VPESHQQERRGQTAALAARVGDPSHLASLSDASSSVCITVGAQCLIRSRLLTLRLRNSRGGCG